MLRLGRCFKNAAAEINSANVLEGKKHVRSLEQLWNDNYDKQRKKWGSRIRERILVEAKDGESMHQLNMFRNFSTSKNVAMH